MKYSGKVVLKIQNIQPEKLLYFSVCIILFLVIASGISFFTWKINLLNYIAGIPLCPFHAITGKFCPGCGMSRAFLLLGQLKIQEALYMNLFSVPLLLLMIMYIILGRIPLWLKNKYAGYISLIAVLAFWLIRLLSGNSTFFNYITAVINN
jgi:hypothetical protein